MKKLHSAKEHGFAEQALMIGAQPHTRLKGNDSIRKRNIKQVTA